MSAEPEDLSSSIPSAQLYVASSDGTWIEYGSGEVEVASESSAPGGDPASPPQIVMVSVPTGSSECLLRTNVSDSCVYSIHDETTLLWMDPAIGCDIAINFSSKEMCEKTLARIQSFQRSANNEDSLSQWAVTAPHLPRILAAAKSDPYHFGAHMRSHDHYFSELAALFRQLLADKDEANCSILSEVVLTLLRPPYTTDNAILAQLVESVNDCIDMVQYGLGKRDEESGFVSAAQRQSTFKNPCGLDDSLLDRIHILFSCQYLRDLLPLSLDDSDPTGSSPLLKNLDIFQNQLLEQICTSDTYLPNTFSSHMTRESTAPEPHDFVRFVLDLSKCLKSASVDVEMKAACYLSLYNAGMLPFFTHVLSQVLERVDEDGFLTANDSRVVQSICETLTHSVMVFPISLLKLTAEASSTPDHCTLGMVFKCLLVINVSAAQSALHDLIASIALPVFGSEPYRKEVVSYAVSEVEGAPIQLMCQRLVSFIDELEHCPSDVTARKGLISGWVLKMLKVIVEMADPQALAPLWSCLRTTQLFSSLARFVRKDFHILSNLQTTAISFVSCVVKSGDPRSVVERCEESRVIEAAIEVFLLRCRRNSILTSTIANLISTVATAARYSTDELLPVFFSDLSNTSDADFLHAPLLSGEPRSRRSNGENPFGCLAAALMQRYGEALKISARTLYLQLQSAVASAELSHGDYRNSLASSSPVDSSDVSPIAARDEAAAEDRYPGQKSKSEQPEEAVKKLKFDDC